MSSPATLSYPANTQKEIRRLSASGIECLLDVLKSQQMSGAVLDWLHEAKDCINAAIEEAEELYGEPETPRDSLGRTIDEYADDPRRGQGTPDALRRAGAL